MQMSVEGLRLAVRETLFMQMHAERSLQNEEVLCSATCIFKTYLGCNTEGTVSCPDYKPVLNRGHNIAVWCKVAANTTVGGSHASKTMREDDHRHRWLLAGWLVADFFVFLQGYTIESRDPWSCKVEEISVSFLICTEAISQSIYQSINQSIG